MGKFDGRGDSLNLKSDKERVYHGEGDIKGKRAKQSLNYLKRIQIECSQFKTSEITQIALKH